MSTTPTLPTTTPIVSEIPSSIFIVSNGVTKKFPPNYVKFSKMVQLKVLEAPKGHPRLNIYLPLNQVELEFVLLFLESLHKIIRNAITNSTTNNIHNSSNNNSSNNINSNNNNKSKNNNTNVAHYSNEKYRWLNSYKLDKVTKGELYKSISLRGQGLLIPRLIMAADSFDIIDNYLVRAIRNNLESYLSNCQSQIDASSHFGFISQEFQFTDLELEKIEREKHFGMYPLRDIATEQSFLYNSYADRKSFEKAMAKLKVNNNNTNSSKSVNKNKNQKKQKKPKENKQKEDQDEEELKEEEEEEQEENEHVEEEEEEEEEEAEEKDDDFESTIYDIVDEVLPRRPEVPMHDSKRCQNSSCHVDFTTLNRKHHCRNCGKIYCSKCSSLYVENSELPKLMYYNHYDWFGKERRVCKSCFETIRLPTDCHDTIKALKLLALRFDMLRRFSCVCPLWRKSSILYLSEVRFIQYKFPTHSFSDFERKVLWRNRESFTGHSLWLLKLLISIDYNEISLEKCKKVLSCIEPDSKKNCACYLLMCSGGCRPTISPLNVIPLLDKNVKSLEIRAYAVDILKQLDSILFVLPQLVFLLRYEPLDHQLLLEFLISKALSSKELAYSFLWELKNNQKSIGYANRYEQIRFKLISALSCNDSEIIESFSNGFELVHILQQHPVSNTPNMEHLVKLKSLEKSKLIFPVNPVYRILRFDIDTAEIIDSATKPIKLKCLCEHSEQENHKVFTLMLKKDDLRNDQVIMNIVGIMDEMVSQKMGEGFPKAVTYRVQPTGEDFGFIEIVENSKTLATIYKDHPCGVMSSFSDPTGRDRHTFINKVDLFNTTLATWIVFTHLLGVGDRHHGNVMITEDGKLFHIDYGFILGKEPKPTPNFIRNDKNFEHLFFNSEANKKHFRDLCVELFLHLRRESNLFLYHLLFLTRFEPNLNNRFNEKYIEEEVASRFVPGLSDAEAAEHFLYIIEQNTFRPIIDFFNKNRNMLQNLTDKISSSCGYLQDYLTKLPSLWGPAQTPSDLQDPSYHNHGDDF
ncbi:hypothetical protein CYY_003755 [Polysphondylium violaceum]|uniref:Phosphatidylinositol 3-kinase n=1 Tax=Polysphondylium violaceum TaxID=133409 RepID=A0A8J4PYK8_9MYCE|nr:hypothetical protein CYY_003755 [Polysphondylium violaceum]